MTKAKSVKSFFSLLLYLLTISHRNRNRHELKQELQVSWDNLPQGPVNNAVKNFTKRLK